MKLQSYSKVITLTALGLGLTAAGAFYSLNEAQRNVNSDYQRQLDVTLKSTGSDLNHYVQRINSDYYQLINMSLTNVLSMDKTYYARDPLLSFFEKNIRSRSAYGEGEDLVFALDALTHFKVPYVSYNFKTKELKVNGAVSEKQEKRLLNARSQDGTRLTDAIKEKIALDRSFSIFYFGGDTWLCLKLYDRKTSSNYFVLDSYLSVLNKTAVNVKNIFSDIDPVMQGILKDDNVMIARRGQPIFKTGGFKLDLKIDPASLRRMVGVHVVDGQGNIIKNVSSIKEGQEAYILGTSYLSSISSYLVMQRPFDHYSKDDSFYTMAKTGLVSIALIFLLLIVLNAYRSGLSEQEKQNRLSRLLEKMQSLTPEEFHRMLAEAMDALAKHKAQQNSATAKGSAAPAADASGTESDAASTASAATAAPADSSAKADAAAVSADGAADKTQSDAQNTQSDDSGKASADARAADQSDAQTDSHSAEEKSKAAASDSSRTQDSQKDTDSAQSNDQAPADGGAPAAAEDAAAGAHAAGATATDGAEKATGSDDKADSQSEKAAAQSGTAKDADQDRDNSKAAETGNDQAQSQTRDGTPQDSSGQQAATAGASSAASTGSAAGAGAVAGADDAHGADHGDEPAALPELSEDDIAFIEDHMVNSFIAQSGVNRTSLEGAVVSQTFRLARHLESSCSNTVHELRESLKAEFKNRMNVYRMEGKFMAARSMLLSALPSEDAMPSSNYVDFAACTVPARELSGNFYTIKRLKAGNLAFIIGDCASSGVKAAYTVTVVNTLLEEALRNDMDPSQIMNYMNDRLCSMSRISPVSLFVGMISETTGNIISCNAGHCCPVIIDRKRPRFICSENDKRLGTDRNMTFDTIKCSLSRDDMILLYTRGVINVRNAQDNVFGLERLMEHCMSGRSLRADELVINVLNDIKMHKGKRPFREDVSLICLKQLLTDLRTPAAD